MFVVIFYDPKKLILKQNLKLVVVLCQIKTEIEFLILWLYNVIYVAVSLLLDPRLIQMIATACMCFCEHNENVVFKD